LEAGDFLIVMGRQGDLATLEACWRIRGGREAGIRG